VRSVFAVASGTALGQVVVVAFSPLITRIYSPEVFGLQGVFLSLISILGPLIALRYPMAIIIADSDDEALKIGRLALYVALIVACIMWGVLLVGGQTVTTHIGAEGLGPLVFLLPLALLSVAVQNISDYRAARLGVFRLVGIVSVLQALVTNLARVLGGLWSPVAAILIAVTTLAPAVKSAMFMMGSKEMRARAPALTRSDAMALLKKYRDFPIFRAPTDVLNAASQAIPVILLSALFTPVAAGLYVLTRSILNLPTNVLGAAVGNVIYARFGELQRSGQPLLPLLLKTTLALLCLAPIIITLAWFAPPFFAFAFGEEWREAGHYAQWMSLWIAVAIANVPSVRLAPIIEAQDILLGWNLCLLGARILAFLLIVWRSGSDLHAVVAYSAVSAVANIILIAIFFRVCIKHDRFS
jgi:O-antigen/teichoic acid export membrane protein